MFRLQSLFSTVVLRSCACSETETRGSQQTTADVNLTQILLRKMTHAASGRAFSRLPVG
jgi:hypothetical protein